MAARTVETLVAYLAELWGERLVVRMVGKLVRRSVDYLAALWALQWVVN